MIQTASILLAVVVIVRGSVPHGTVSSQYHAQDELGQYTYGYAGGPSSKSETKTADGVVRGEYSYIDAHGIIQTAHYVADPHHGFRVVASNDPSGPLAHSATVPVALPAPARPVPVAHAAPVPLAHSVPLPVAHRPAYRYPTVYEAGLIPGFDTPEVQAARAAHLHAVAETKARDSLINRYPYPQGASYVPYAATHSHYSYYVPVPVKDTPEVAAAKAAHFAAVHEAKSRIPEAYSYPGYGNGGYYPYYASGHAYHVPVPVKDTPEVAAAKVAHFAAVNEAKARNYHASSYPGYYPYASSHSYHVPVPVQDTPEVAAAKAAHLAVVHEAKSRIAHQGYPSYSHYYAPTPVTDTPAVAHAKAAHLAVVHEAKSRIAHQGYPSYSHYYAPTPVTDTPAVAHAKAAHLATVHQAKSLAYSHYY